MPAAKQGSVINETLAAGEIVAKDERRDGLHRQCHGRDLRPGLDARAAEDVRRPGDAADVLLNVQSDTSSR